MMSNPQNTIQRRQQIHRRQNSTPVASEANKIPLIPRPGPQQLQHRRGQSLDNRNRAFEQDLGGINTNTGLTTTGHQPLREAQQTKPARPGQASQQIPSPLEENFFPNEQFFPFSTSNPSTPAEYCNDPTLMDPMNGQFEISNTYPNDMKLQLSTTFEAIPLDVESLNYQDYFQPSHPSFISTNQNMMNTRRQSQPELVSYAHQPSTPINQSQNSPFPLTPSTNSFKNSGQLRQYPATAHSSPTKAHFDPQTQSFQTPMQRGRSFPGQLQSTHSGYFPSPPGTIRFSTGHFDTAPMPEPRSSTAESFTMLPSRSNQSHASSHATDVSSPSPQILSFRSSPETAHLPYHENERAPIPRLDKIPIPVFSSSQAMPNLCSTPTSPVRASISPRRMSISDLNLEPGTSASIEETNITLDDIAHFIEGPDPLDNKWICTYEGCNKRFGRKENIKSHVQTHLGDRQFRCDHCKKCFVRGHDLKRHAKIHTGAKPYPCDCGNSFARHDALTRHRQRGMCIGAFDGVVKKPIKRGRPRKHRPEMDERVDKAARTRRRVNEQGYQYASSSSDDSMSSAQSPPTETLESMSIRDSSPFNDMALFETGSSNENLALPPQLLSFTPPASPGYSTGNKPSPTHRSFTPIGLLDMVDLPSSPTPLQLPTSHESPPSLCNTSSSPVPEATMAFQYSDDTSDLLPELPKSIMRTDFDDLFGYSEMDPSDEEIFMG